MKESKLSPCLPDDTADAPERALQEKYKAKVVAYQAQFSKVHEEDSDSMRDFVLRQTFLLKAIYSLCVLLVEAGNLSHAERWLAINAGTNLSADIGALHDKIGELKTHVTEFSSVLVELESLFFLYMRFPVGVSAIPHAAMPNFDENIASGTTASIGLRSLTGLPQAREAYESSVRSLETYLGTPSQQRSSNYLEYLVYSCELRLLLAAQDLLLTYGTALPENPSKMAWLITEVLALKKCQDCANMDTRHGLAKDVAADLFKKGEDMLSKHHGQKPNTELEWLRGRETLRTDVIFKHVSSERIRCCPGGLFSAIAERVAKSRVETTKKALREDIRERRKKEVQDLEALHKTELVRSSIQDDVCEIQRGAAQIRRYLEERRERASCIESVNQHLAGVSML